MSNLDKIQQIEQQIEELKASVASLKANLSETQEEIDWSDPKWVGRLVEVRDYDSQEWRVVVCHGSKDRLCKTLHGSWKQARPYTGPTRPNWIEWNGGECPVNQEDCVLVQFRDGDLGFTQACACVGRHAIISVTSCATL